jgi:hypothetical protein
MAISPAGPDRMAAPTLALVASLVYATAEILRQLVVPSPPGVPGDSGGSLLSLLALALLACTGPALLVAQFSGRWRGSAEFLSLTAGAWIFGTAGLWRALDRAGLLLDDAAWGPAGFFAPGLGLALLAAAAGLPVARRWPARFRVPRRIVLALLLLSLGQLGRGLRSPGMPEAEPLGGPNLLLVTIDTVRRDGLSSYGGSSPTALDSLGATVHEAWAVSSWTQPSMASLFSGTVPTGHGSDRTHGPDPAVAWWTESIAITGAQTAAIVTNPYLRRRFGFDRGFAHFDHVEERPWLEPVARTILAEWVQAWMNRRPGASRADTVVGRAVDWLEDADPERPWFLWVHLLDPHLPYELRGVAGRVATPSPPDWIAPLTGRFEDGGLRGIGAIRDGEVLVGDDERRALHQLYQTEVDFSAWWTRELIRAAGEQSPDRELVWVVTSDHGEEFFEEGGFEHGHSLGDPVLRVPLLSSGLGAEARVVRLIDLGPWIVSTVWPESAAEFEPARGSQLLETDHLLQPYALAQMPAVADCDRPSMLAEGLLYGPSRTLFVSHDGRRTERQDETGNLRELSGCRDESSRESGVGAPWRELDLWRERRTISPLRLEVDDDLRRQLRTLGYVR